MGGVFVFKMVVSLKSLVGKVESSRVFKSFIKEHPHYYLAHCFAMISGDEEGCAWELGYYSEKSDKLVVFETKPRIRMRPAEEVFKRSGVVKKLDLGAVRVGVKRALGVCEDVVRSKYAGERITKRIVILQHLDRQVYNITLVSRSFNIINIRVDARTGVVLEDDIRSIMSLGRKQS